MELDWTELMTIINNVANAITQIGMIIAVPTGGIIWARKAWKAKPHMTKEEKARLRNLNAQYKAELLKQKEQK